MSNLSTVTDNMLPVSSETFVDNLAAGISAGADTVPLLSLSEYNDGDSIVLTVDPGTADQATFIGEVQGNDVINCEWTEGNVGASHAAGATVIDYDSATHYNVVTKLLRMFANQDGSLKTPAVQAALNISSAVPADWTPLANVPTVTATNGQREQVLTYTGIDYTDRLQAGSKLRIPRTITAPTQSAKFVAASSHHASKATPTGVNLTTMFSVEGNLRIDSYKQGHILGNRNGTGGWNIELLDTGQLSVYYSNGTNITTTVTHRSMPINETVHFMCAVNVTTKAVTIYIDGESVPTAQSPSTATTMTNGTTLRMGSYDGSSFFLDATLSNIRLWNTIRTQAETRDNMYKETPTSTAGLIGHWKLNGNFNDSSVNANNLTPSTVTATNPENPFSAIEYAKIKKVALVTGNTEVTIQANYGIPTEVLAATAYSSMQNPYGFPQSLQNEVIQYVEVRKDQTPIGAADLLGLTFTINPIPGRKIRLSAHGSYNNDTGSNYGEITIFEGANTLVRDDGAIAAANLQASSNPAIEFVPTPGQHTYKLNLAYFTGAGTLKANMGTAGNSPAWFKAEYC